MSARDAGARPPTPLRLGVPRALPLEIWRLLLPGGGSFSTAVRKQPARLLEGLELLHRGEGRTRDARVAHQACAGYEHLVIGGGRARDISDALLRRGPTPFTRLPHDHIGETGGLALAAEAGFPAARVLVVDLGQTSIKASYAGRRRQLPRDLELLPRGRLASSRRHEQREALCAFLAEAMREATAGLPAPQAVVFGLPGEVSAHAVPGKSTYVGAANDAALLSDALVRAGLCPEMIGVLNDAELAAASAALLPAAAVKTLVLTLGFGLGAALLHDPDAMLPRHGG